MWVYKVGLYQPMGPPHCWQTQCCCCCWKTMVVLAAMASADGATSLLMDVVLSETAAVASATWGGGGGSAEPYRVTQSCQPLHFGHSLLRLRAQHYAATLMVISHHPPKNKKCFFSIPCVHVDIKHTSNLLHMCLFCVWCWLVMHSQLVFKF